MAALLTALLMLTTPTLADDTCIFIVNEADVPAGTTHTFKHGAIDAILVNFGGEYRAYYNSCTHAGSPIDIQGDVLNCPLHGSQFAPADGTVVTGPAATPLHSIPVTTKDGGIYTGTCTQGPSCGDGTCSESEDCRDDDAICTGGLYCGNGCIQRPNGMACDSDEACASGNCAIDWENAEGTCAPEGNCVHGDGIDFISLVTVSGDRYCNDTLWQSRKVDGDLCDPAHPIMCSERRCVGTIDGSSNLCCVSGCALEDSCVPSGTREGSMYCDDMWWEQLADGAACTTSAACANATCVEDVKGGPSICCARECVSGGVCYGNETQLDGMYCAGEWEVLRHDGASCTADWECTAGLCAEDKLTGNGLCCPRDCVYNGICSPTFGQAVGLFCNVTGSWEQKREEGSPCHHYFQCLGDTCASSDEGSLCCASPGCTDADKCMPVGSQIEDRYCESGTWRYFTASECEKDYECKSNQCVDDVDGDGRHCCATQCVFNATCYPLYGRAADHWCNDTAWIPQLAHGAPCDQHGECFSSWCAQDKNGTGLCGLQGSCLHSGEFHPSGESALLGEESEYCLEGVWHDCLDDDECGTGRWCDENLTCRDPFCGNQRCEAGECADGCADCSLTVCIGDGTCSTAIGESCASSGDCVCPGGMHCSVSDPLRDTIGCVRVSCGDGVCNKTAGECLSGCAVDCNSTTCIGDGACSPAVGENCSTSADCLCPSGLVCRSGEAGVDWMGCYNPACGNNVCDIDRDECDAGCPDCSPETCAGDSTCSPRIGEDCSTTEECACTPPLRCQAGAADADLHGCAPPPCGDGTCDASETCDLCPDDCGNCFLIQPQAVTLSEEEGEGTEVLTISSLSKSAYFAAVIEVKHPSTVEVLPSRLLVQPGMENSVMLTLKTSTAVSGKGEIVLAKESSGEVLAKVSLTVSVEDTGPSPISLPQPRIPISGDTGATVTFYFPVLNEGEGDARVAMTPLKAGTAASWVILDVRELSIPAGVQRMVLGRISIPPDAPGGAHEVAIDVTGGAQMVTAYLVITVSSTAIVCGDGACGTGEDCSICPQDCPCEKRLVLELPANATVDTSLPGPARATVTVRNPMDRWANCTLVAGRNDTTITPLNLTLAPGNSSQVVVIVDIPDTTGEILVPLAVMMEGDVVASANLTVRVSDAVPREVLTARVATISMKVKDAASALESARHAETVTRERLDALDGEADAIREVLDDVRAHLDAGRQSDAEYALERAGRDMDKLHARLDTNGILAAWARPSSTPTPTPEKGDGWSISWGGVLIVGMLAALILVPMAALLISRRRPPKPAAPTGSYYGQYSTVRY